VSGRRTIAVLLRASILGSLQYRADVVFEGLRSLFELAWTLVPLLVVFGARGHVAGWSLPEALLVTAWFVFLKALLDGLIVPSVVSTIELIRRGTFDFVLVKPVDAQVWASFGKIDLFAGVDMAGAIVLFTIATLRLPHAPGISEVALALAATIIAIAILYAINVAALSVAFYVARIDNLTFLIGSIFDAARWPSTIFRGVARLIFTFLLPLGLMTTYPPLALLGRLSPEGLLVPLGAAVAALLVSRLLWLRGVAAYRSASS
jgi:ABC-2 type transport system permease protein